MIKRSKTSRLARLRHLAILGAVAFALAAIQAAGAQQPQPPPPVKEQIEKIARNDARQGVPRMVSVQERFRGEGLTQRQIAVIYEDAFAAARRKAAPGAVEKFFQERWYIPLLIFMALWAGVSDAVKSFVSRWVGRLLDVVFNRFSSWPLLRKRVLSRYRRSVVTRLRELRLPFRSPLDVEELYVGTRVEDKHRTDGVLAIPALRESRRSVVLGDPGAGKTVLLRRIAFRAAKDPPFMKAQSTVLVGLGSLPALDDAAAATNPDRLVDEIIERFRRHNFPGARPYVEKALRDGELLVLLDALDEVPSQHRQQVTALIRNFFERYDACPAVLTCREAVYSDDLHDVLDAKFVIAEFRERDVSKFLSRWPKTNPDKTAAQLMTELEDRPRLASVTRNPLMLTVLAWLYFDQASFTLPGSRTAFYKAAADIMLTQWNVAQNEKSPSHKRNILQRVARLAQEGKLGANRRTLAEQDVIPPVQMLLPRLAVDASETQAHLTEIVERSGLLLKLGDVYEFAHPTWQEFFAAEDLIGQHTELLTLYGQDPDAWREVVKFWCGLENNDSTPVLREIGQRDRQLALEALADAWNVDGVVALELTEWGLDQLDPANPVDGVERALGAIAADPRERGDRVLNALIREFEAAGHDKAEPYARCLGYSNTRQAVAALAARHEDAPFVRAPLVRVGDLAIDALESLAANGSVAAMDDLLAIGTPKAARALAQLVARPHDGVARPAAWRLGAILATEARDGLLDEPIEIHLTEEDQDYMWLADNGAYVWPSPLRGLIARTARLLGTTPDRFVPSDPPHLHPGLVVPLCGIDCSALPRVAEQPPRPETIEAAAEIFGGRRFAVTGDGEFRAEHERGTTLISPGSILGHAAPVELLQNPPARGNTCGELLRGVVSELAACDCDDDAEKELTDAVERFINCYLDQADCPKVTRTLIGAVTVPTRLLLLHGLTAKQRPTREEWQAGNALAFMPKRWQRAVARVLLVALGVAAAWGMWRTVRDHEVSLLSAAAIIGLLGTAYGTYRILRAAARARTATFAREYVMILLLALPLGLIAGFGRLWRRRWPLLPAGFVALMPFSPGIVALSTTGIADWVHWALPAAVWLLIIVGTFARFAKVVQSTAGSPLGDVGRFVRTHPPESREMRSLRHLIETHLRRRPQLPADEPDARDEIEHAT